MKPFPEIARFPGEPPLTGTPHAAKESIFLSTPGLSQAMETVVDTRDMNSKKRHRYISQLPTSLGTKQYGQVVEAIETFTSKSLTDSDRGRDIRRIANVLYETVKPQDKKSEKPTFNHEFLDALTDSESFSSHLEAYHRYLTTPEKKRSTVLTEQAGKLFQNPKALLLLAIRSSALTEHLQDDASPVVSSYKEYNQALQQVLVNLAKNSKQAPLESKNLVQWMNILCTESGYAQVAESLLTKWLAVEDIDTGLNRLHQLATSVITSERDMARKKLCEILLLQTDIMLFDSNAAINYTLASAFGSLETRQQRREIDEALSLIVPKDFAKSRIVFIKQSRSEAYRRRGKSLRNKLFSEEGEKGLAERYDESLSQVIKRRTIHRMRPQRSMTDLTDDQLVSASDLRRWINKNVSQIHRTKKLSGKRNMVGEIQFPDITRVIKAPLPQIVREVRQILDAISGQEFARPEHWRTLGLLVQPELDQKRLDALNKTNETLRQEIKDERLRNISKRGDRIFIRNGQLNELGFRQLEIYPDQENGYQIRIAVGDNVFVGKMDKEWQLLNTDFDTPLQMPITGAFLEHIILCHTHELLCSKFENDGENDSEANRQFYSRRDHQRVLPIGEKPSDKQILKAWFDYGIDLIARNKKRLTAGETQLITWVSSVDRIDIAGTGPVESYPLTATNQFDKIFSKCN